MTDAENKYSTVAKIAFENALHAELPNDNSIDGLISAFESACGTDDAGNEFRNK